MYRADNMLFGAAALQRRMKRRERAIPEYAGSAGA
jgi:hypothetical protein